MAANSAKNRGRSGWRRQTGTTETEIAHRWQSADVPSAEKRQQNEGRGKRLALLVLFVLAIGLTGYYIRSLLVSPVQTPVIIVTGGPYPAPFAPNAWAAGDASALSDLDGKTLSVLRTNHLRDLESKLESAVQSQKGCATVVIVLSMHGAVDDAGNPCLVPPNGSPLDSKTWIPLSVILARIQKSGIADDVTKLLILDCNRVRVSWQQGTIYNLFTESLELSKVISKSEIPNLVVMNSVRPGQKGWATDQLQGTVFGHFLRMGLAGKADSKSEGGNGDRSVSFHELRNYLDHHVDRWVQHHLGERQRPLVLTSTANGNPPDFHVAWAMRGTLPEKTLSEPVVSQAEIDKYWEAHDRFREFDPMVYDPLTWAEFQRTLLLMESAATAGPGYDVMTRKTQARLNDLITRLSKQQSQASRPESLYEDLATFSQFAGPRVQPLNLYSSPLSKYLGSLTEEELKSAANLFGDFRRTPTGATLRGHLNHKSAKTAFPDLDEVHFLRLLNRFEIAELWPEADLLRLLDVRAMGASAAVPVDERVHPWIQQFVDEGDRSRREAENAFFAGPKQMKSAWDQQRAAAETAYTRANSIKDSTSAAYRLRDRVTAELPWLANWLLHRFDVAATDPSQTDSPNEVLFRLIRSNRELSRILRKPGDSPADVYQRVADDFEKLNALYDEECERLLNAETTDAKTLRRIHAVLQVALVPSGQRQAFRQQRVDSRQRLKRLANKIAEQRKQDYQPTAAREATAANGKANGEVSQAAAELLIRLDLLDRLGQSAIHPVLSLIDAGEEATESTKKTPETERDASSSVQRLAASQNRLRGRLSLIAQNAGRTRNLSVVDPQAYREALLNAEEAIRAVAAFPLPMLNVDPNARRRRFDLQQLLVWHATRAVEDFWGAAGNEELPFFQRSALGYWETAVDFDNSFAGIFDQQKTSRAWIDRRVEAARNGLKTEVAPARQLNAGEKVNVDVSILFDLLPGKAEHRLSTMPAGTASVFISDGSRRIGKQLQPVKVPNTAKPNESLAKLKFEVGDEPMSKPVRGLQAVTLFRGHAYSTPLNVGMAGGVSVRVKPQQQTRSTLSLSGTNESPASVVFILDCSQSMRRKTNQPGAPTRLEVAVKALGDLMDQLVKRGNTQVGVLFYGHRAAWNSDATKIVRQTGYDANIDKEMLPLEDVETVATLGRFDATAANFIKNRMKRLRPWGETPLFLSVREAIKQLSIADADSNRRIVLITDGEDYQLVPRDLQLTAEQTAKLTVLEDITGTLRKNPVPIHILGFEMSAPETQRVQAAFEQIKQISGGSYAPAVNARVLFPTLESLLGPSRYSVLNDAGATLASANLGSPVRLKVSDTKTGRMTATVGTARTTFPIEGGEAFQLVISKNGNSIESVRYLRGQPRFVPLVIGELGAASGVLAGVHLPERDGKNPRDVTFPVSFQREDRGVTQRFGDVWIEVTPLAKDGQPVGEPYVYLDPEYASGLPVPVVNLLATNWPEAATKAAIRIWCHDHRTKPAKTLTIASLIKPADKEVGKATTQTVVLGGVELRVESKKKDGRFTLRLIEKHPESGPTYAPMRVEVQGKGVSPTEILRRFDVRNRMTVHTFEFAAIDEAAVRAATLAVTTRDSVIGTGAKKLARPIVIDVARSGGVIRLNGPALK